MVSDFDEIPLSTVFFTPLSWLWSIYKGAITESEDDCVLGFYGCGSNVGTHHNYIIAVSWSLHMIPGWVWRLRELSEMEGDGLVVGLFNPFRNKTYRFYLPCIFGTSHES